MRAQYIHGRIKVDSRIVFAEAGQAAQRQIGIATPGEKIDHGGAERIIDDRIQLPAQQILPHHPIAFLARGIFPDLADQHGLRILLLQFPIHFLHEFSRQLVHHIQPPAGRPLAQPVLDHAVRAIDDEFPIRGFQLVDIRQGGHAPPAIIAIRILQKPVPRKVWRIRGSPGVPEIDAFRTGVAEYAVQNQTNSSRFRRPPQAFERRVAAELGVHRQIITRVIFMIGYGGKNRIQIQYRNTEAF